MLYKCNTCSLGFYYPFITGNDKFYNILSTNDWYYLQEDKNEYAYANSFNKDNDKILGVGCGIGRFKNYITAKNIEFRGLELNIIAIQQAKKKIG